MTFWKLHLTVFRTLAQFALFFFFCCHIQYFPHQVFFTSGQSLFCCSTRPPKQPDRQISEATPSINVRCTLASIPKGQHYHLNIIQFLCILQSLTATKSKEAIAMGCTVHIGRVDAIKIHFLASPVQLLLCKAVDFPCLLQFRFSEFLNLSHILFVRYLGR